MDDSQRVVRRRSPAEYQQPFMPATTAAAAAAAGIVDAGHCRLTSQARCELGSVRLDHVIVVACSS